MKTSLGLLEVSGLALAISAADLMAKAASITLVDIEKTNGSGWTVIKLTGDVAAVKSAIETGASFAQKHNGLISQSVLARPADALTMHWLETNATVIKPIEKQPHKKPSLTKPLQEDPSSKKEELQESSAAASPMGADPITTTSLTTSTDTNVSLTTPVVKMPTINKTTTKVTSTNTVKNKNKKSAHKNSVSTKSSAQTIAKKIQLKMQSEEFNK